MSISPILNSGMIQRTDDVGVLKLQQEQRPVAEQQNAQLQMTRKADEFSHQVVTPADSNKTDTHADAREEGKNKYFFQSTRKKVFTKAALSLSLTKNTAYVKIIWNFFILSTSI